MRTTVTVADDVAAEVDRLRRDEGLGPSEALMKLARRGMSRRAADVSYRHTTASLGLRLDVSDVGSVLEILDDEQASST